MILNSFRFCFKLIGNILGETFGGIRTSATIKLNHSSDTAGQVAAQPDRRRLMISMVTVSSSSSSCRRADEHGGEEEAEAAPEPDHLQQQPAAGAGAGLRADALPGRLRQGGPGPPGQPHRGPRPGEAFILKSPVWFALTPPNRPDKYI